MGIPRSLLMFVAVVVTAISSRESEAAESKFNALIELGVNLCAADPPSVIDGGGTLVRCATRCSLLTSCVHFNYRSDEKICELYQFTPESYSSVPVCAHYQVRQSCKNHKLCVYCKWST